MKLNMTNHSISTRAAGILCGLMFLLTRTPTLGAQGGAELSLPAVNRTVPEHTPPVILPNRSCGMSGCLLNHWFRPERCLPQRRTAN